ncbi:MAG: hypothetical protein IPP44_12305 [Ideonella sp.]|nr:hypothetical protein [Ideonella sp.]
MLAARSARHEGELTGRDSTDLRPFPPRRSSGLYPAGKLSGGQKQMLAVALAARTASALILIDEREGGLAPSIVQNLVGLPRVEAAEDHHPAGGAELHDGQGVRLIRWR